MTRNENGHLSFSPQVLGTIIATCLAVGSGGAWAAKSYASAEPAYLKMVADLRVEIQDQATTIVRLEERDKARDERLARIEATLEKVDSRIERLLRRDR